MQWKCRQNHGKKVFVCLIAHCEAEDFLVLELSSALFNAAIVFIWRRPCILNYFSDKNLMQFYYLNFKS